MRRKAIVQAKGLSSNGRVRNGRVRNGRVSEAAISDRAKDKLGKSANFIKDKKIEVKRVLRKT